MDGKEKRMTGVIRIIREKIKKNAYILMILLIGVVLLLWPSSEKKGKDTEKTAAGAEDVSFSVMDEEERLSAVLGEISGAGKVRVMLTVKASRERIIASDSQVSERRNTDGAEETYEEEESAVIISTGSSTDGVVTLKYIYPEYLGAVVVSEGADSPEVRYGIMKAVAAVTGLSSDRITVLKMK